MSLSCTCGEPETEPGMKVLYGPQNYSELETLRRKRCCSCNDLIDIGSIVAKFDLYKVPESDIEVNIWGEDGYVPGACSLSGPGFSCNDFDKWKPYVGGPI